MTHDHGVLRLPLKKTSIHVDGRDVQRQNDEFLDCWCWSLAERVVVLHLACTRKRVSLSGSLGSRPLIL
jgi:hypothetical protein